MRRHLHEEKTLVTGIRSANELVRSGCLQHIAVRAHAGAGALHILPKDSIIVRIGACFERLLGGLLVLRLAQPSDDACLLQCLAVGEGEMPRKVRVELVHGAEVDGSLLLVVLVQGRLTREEENAWHGHRHRAQQRLHREFGNRLGTRLGTFETVLDHVRLQHGTLQVDVVVSQGFKLGRQHLLRHLATVVNVVVSVGHDLGLHDGHQALTLADGRIACQRVNGVHDGQVARQAFLGIKLEHIAPFGEAGPFLVGLRATFLKVIQAFRGNLWMSQGPNLRAPHALLVVSLVHLDAGDHAVAGDDVHHRLAVGIVLEKRLPVEDDATDVLAESRGGEAHGAVGGPVLNDIRDLCRFCVAGTQPWSG
mmetsp:Transcript_109127/g.152548  ORF Transcript_109127/g.152548 Transcript_109127/m.152548 type:complete len:365 (-) Transcript_109127:137-1231(-)